MRWLLKFYVWWYILLHFQTHSLGPNAIHLVDTHESRTGGQARLRADQVSDSRSSQQLADIL